MTNLGKKDNRLQVLKYEFENLTKNGYTKEEYKDINIFTLDKDGVLILKVYRGTSTNPIHYIRYRTRERIQEVTKRYKDWADLREKRKEEQGGKKTLTGAALCAASIRTELKKQFPNSKFSVTSETFAGGNSVDICWTNGPTTDQVKEFANKYQYGHFNGMEDIYENTNSREDIPQVKYVSESRNLSDEIIKEVATKLQEVKTYTDQQIYSYNESPETEAKQLLYQTVIPFDYISLKIVRCDNSSNRHPFKIVFETEQQPEQPKKQPTRSEPQPTAKSGKIQIVDYSEKAIAVIGDTKPIKELLKSLGGSFNARLSCGPGWIFSKKKLQELQTALLNINNAKTEETPKEEEQDLTPVLFSEIKAIQEPETLQAEEIQEIPGPPPAINEALILESFKILWHEGRHIEGAIFEGATFTDWQEVQKAFFKLWEVNEKGSDGGYTKVKCEIKLKGSDLITDRIDITNRIKNGDFNPSDMHIVEYLSEILIDTEEPAGENLLRHPEVDYLHPLNVCDSESGQYKEVLMEYEVQHPKKYDSLQEITAAANTGKQVSIYNLFSLIQETTQA